MAVTIIQVTRVRDLGRYLLAEDVDDQYWLIKRDDDSPPKRVFYMPGVAQTH